MEKKNISVCSTKPYEMYFCKSDIMSKKLPFMMLLSILLISVSFTTRANAATYNGTKTVYITGNTLEKWAKNYQYQQRCITGFGQLVTVGDGDFTYWNARLITGIKVLSYRRIAVKARIYGRLKTCYVKLPYKVKFTYHRHDFRNRVSSHSVGRFLSGICEWKFVWTQTCSCGRKYTRTLELPDVSDYYSGTRYIEIY